MKKIISSIPRSPVVLQKTTYLYLTKRKKKKKNNENGELYVQAKIAKILCNEFSLRSKFPRMFLSLYRRPRQVYEKIIFKTRSTSNFKIKSSMSVHRNSATRLQRAFFPPPLHFFSFLVRTLVRTLIYIYTHKRLSSTVIRTKSPIRNSSVVQF